MTPGGSGAPSGRPGAAPLRRLPAAPLRRLAAAPWWVQVLAVHAAARLVGAGILLLVARTQEATPWTPARPSYAQYTGLMWDADWYRRIAEHGYPDSLPTGADGRVQQNAWAFFPLFPALARTVMAVTDAPWHVVAPLLALLLGAAAMLVVHQVVRTVAGARRPWLPLLTVALLTTYPASPVLQVAYTESLALLLVAAVLWCLLHRRYAAALPLVVALGLTRAVALPMVAAVVAHAVARWRSDRRGGEPWPTRDRALLGALAVVTAASGVLWPAVVAWSTGEPDAYTRTQGAWRGRGEVVPLLPWLDVATWLLGRAGLVVLVLLVVGAVAVVASPPMRRLGPELQAWTGAYLAYLLVVVEPGTSLLRFGLLAFPVAAVPGQAVLGVRGTVRRRVLLGAVLAVGVAGQAAWVVALWRLVPPSGWPP